MWHPSPASRARGQVKENKARYSSGFSTRWHSASKGSRLSAATQAGWYGLVSGPLIIAFSQLNPVAR